jgi:hypothetical protein
VSYQNLVEKKATSVLVVGFLLIFGISSLLAGCTVPAPEPPEVEVSEMLYSGRSNPFMLLSSSDVSLLPALFENLPPTSPPEWADYPFGGFLITHSSIEFWEEEGVPIISRAFQGVIEIGSSYFEDIHGLESWLTGRFPNPGEGSVETLRMQLLAESGPPPYEPEKWNAPDDYPLDGTEEERRDFLDKAKAQTRNKCYNYATNNRTDTKAQPGRAGNRAINWTNFSCAEVIAAASADGLVRQENCDTDCPKDHIKVMLFVDDEDDPQQRRDDRDYHWYRQDVGGNWSHKPDEYKATNLDASNKTIADPQKADRDMRRDWDEDDKFDDGYNYNKFCACFCVPPTAKIS